MNEFSWGNGGCFGVPTCMGDSEKWVVTLGKFVLHFRKFRFLESCKGGPLDGRKSQLKFGRGILGNLGRENSKISNEFSWGREGCRLKALCT